MQACYYKPRYYFTLTFYKLSIFPIPDADLDNCMHSFKPHPKQRAGSAKSEGEYEVKC